MDQLQNYTSLYGEKTVELIQNLPEMELTWVVYNANMISQAQMLIIALRGVEFFDEYVHVISRECGNDASGILYFDPNMFKLLGNGYD